MSRSYKLYTEDKPVDVVITWVDGEDPNHQRKLTAYLKKLGITRPEAAAPTRYNECGELSYNVFSWFKFAPWVNKIYIVTANQKPPIIDLVKGSAYASRVELISHDYLFRDYEQHLPTFNSIALESLLWRIESLSDQFIYSNDDCMLIRPIAKKDFFRANQLVLRGEWKKLSSAKLSIRLQHYLDRKKIHLFKKPQHYRIVQENCAKRLGYKKRFFYLPHAPLPAFKHLFHQVFSEHFSLLEKNISYAFRNDEQLLPFSLIHHYALKNEAAVIDNFYHAAYVNPEAHHFDKIKSRLKKAEKDAHIPFICVQSLDQADEPIKEYILHWLKKRIG